MKYLSILPYNGENFRTISMNRYLFLDSLSFLQSSLSNLTETLKNSGHAYNILKQSTLVRHKKKRGFSKEKLDMVLQKGIYPYSYCTSVRQMKKTTKLPPIKAFYSHLTEETVSKSEYQFAKKVWKKYKCSNLIDYCLVYCRTDTLLLAEVVQKFRSTMHDFTGLDPSYYISLPSFAWDSMLKLTNQTLECFTDIDMCLFTESGIRGGLSFIGERYCKADEQKKIFYIDANVCISFKLSFLFFVI